MPDPWVDLETDLYSLQSIAAEIIAFTGQPEAEVWRKLALELESNGTNVIAETKRFGVTPHIFNGEMIRFYNESDGFIYETMVESRHPFRRGKWRQIADFLAGDSLKSPGETNVLLYGDSVGTDSICLKRLGYSVVYHDFDSYCAAFARYRFQQRNLVIPKFSEMPTLKYDYVICLEVAEHVPDPAALVKELRSFLKDPDGVCLFSESFKLLLPKFPTHLESNVKYTGRTDELFQDVGMKPIWRDPDEKPIAYALLGSRPHLVPFRPRPLWRRLGSRIKRSLM